MKYVKSAFFYYLIWLCCCTIQSSFIIISINWALWVGTKAIIIKCNESYFLLLMVPKIELFCLFSFLFFVFCYAFSCLRLFLLRFAICCINQNLHFLDEESSELVICSRWWAMGYSVKTQTGGREGTRKYLDMWKFQGSIKKQVGFPGVFMKI